VFLNGDFLVRLNDTNVWAKNFMHQIKGLVSKPLGSLARFGTFERPFGALNKDFYLFL
jgi:hypothetical protein